MPRYALPAYLPDQLPGNVLIRAENVLPAADGYRPVKQIASVTEPLAAAFKGGGSFIASDGTACLLAGTANGLERLIAGAWTDLLVAMTVSDRWRFAQFGDFVVAVNAVDTKQVDLVAGTASDLTDAPTGNGVAVVGDFVVITQADGNQLMVQWSAFNDHTAWTPAVDQAGFQPMLTGGQVKGIAGGEYGVILQRFRLVRMERTGDPLAPFNFAEITPNFGCASSGSIAQAGRTIFFLSDRGFMALEDGVSLRPIGNEKFDATFRAAVSSDDYEKLYAAVDPKRSLVMWGMPGVPGTIWVYNWVLDRATTIKGSFSGIFPGYEASLTLEEVAGIYPDLDTIPYSLDDPRFQGGDPRLYVVTSDNRLAAFSGANMAASLKMGWIAPSDPLVSRVRALWAISDVREGLTVEIDARQQMGGAQGISTSGTIQASGRVPLRCRGKWLSPAFNFAEGAEWNFIQGFDLEAEAAGAR